MTKAVQFDQYREIDALERVREAYRSLEERHSRGKLVLSMQ
jgi:hypothetical protein